MAHSIMLSSIANALGAARDRAVEAAARGFISQKIQRFGELKRLELDTRQKRMELEVALKGEVSPVNLTIDGYEVVRRGSEAYLVVRQVRASREWIALAAEEYAVGQEFKLPASAAAVL